MLALVGAAFLAAGTASAQPLAPLRPFLKQHCSDCHSGESPEAGFNLATLGDALDDAEVLRRWAYLYDRVAGSEMPPDAADQPHAEAKAVFLNTLSDALTQADLAARETVLRRLNRDEYENTVRDLFGIYVDVERLLPKDAQRAGLRHDRYDPIVVDRTNAAVCRCRRLGSRSRVRPTR